MSVAPGWEIHGNLISRYQLRDSTLDDRDQDLFTWLGLEGGSKHRDPVTVSLAGRSAWDLEGDGLGAFGNSLSTLEDTRGGRHDLRLYRAWAGFHDWIPGGEVRIGRQNLFQAPVLLRLDGAWLRAPAALAGLPGEFQGYAGRPNHYWEGSARGDAAAGASLDLSPWKGGQTRLDFMHLRDRRFFGEASNNLVAGTVSQAGWDGSWWASLSGSFLDGSQRDLDLQGFWSDVDRGWQLQFFAHALRSRQSVNTLEFDPLTAVLLPEEPFYEAQLQASKRLAVAPLGLGSAWRLEGGAYGRQLRDGARESEFNRSYQRFWLGAALEDLPWKGAEVSVHGESWDSGTDEILSASAELRVRFAEAWDVSLGTHYSLYQYDFFAQLERDNVRSWTLRVKWQALEDLRLQTSLEILEDDIEDFQVFWIQGEVDF